MINMINDGSEGEIVVNSGSNKSKNPTQRLCLLNHHNGESNSGVNKLANMMVGDAFWWLEMVYHGKWMVYHGKWMVIRWLFDGWRLSCCWGADAQRWPGLDSETECPKLINETSCALNGKRWLTSGVDLMILMTKLIWSFGPPNWSGPVGYQIKSMNLIIDNPLALKS